MKMPSKYTSLEKLLAIRDNNSLSNITKGKAKEYCTFELNELIILKTNKAIDKKNCDLIKAYDSLEKYSTSNHVFTVFDLPELRAM